MVMFFEIPVISKQKKNLRALPFDFLMRSQTGNSA